MTPTDTPMPAWLESAWLARYLDRQLSGEELAWFEAYLLDKRELLAMVEADNGVRDALGAEPLVGRVDVERGHEKLSSQAARTSDFEPRSDTLSRKDRFRKFAHVPALAAALVAGVGVGWIAQSRRSLNQDESSLIANPTRLVFDTMRGATAASVLEHAGPGSRYALIEVAVPATATNVRILAKGRMWTLSPSPDGFVSFLIEKSKIDAYVPINIEFQLDGQTQKRLLEEAQLKEAGNENH